jgi:hypothetical protein
MNAVLSDEKLSEILNLTVEGDFVDPEGHHAYKVKSVLIENKNLSDEADERFFVNLLTMHKDTIEQLSLTSVVMSSVDSLRTLLKPLAQLKHFEAVNINFKATNECAALALPNLQSISLGKSETNVEFKSVEAMFELFMGSETIESVRLQVVEEEPFNVMNSKFDKLLASLPQLKSLKMEGKASGGFFEKQEFPFKVKQLEVELVGYYWRLLEPRTLFLKSQVGHLKELTLQNLPYDYDGGEVLRFILNEMSLEKFNYDTQALILDSKKQAIKELSFKEVTIGAGLEMLRHFPSE